MKKNDVGLNSNKLTLPVHLGLLGRVFFFAGNISTMIALVGLLISEAPEYYSHNYDNYLENGVYLMPFSLGLAFIYRIIRYHSGYRNKTMDNIQQSWFRLFLSIIGFLVIGKMQIINFDYQSCVKMLLLYFPIWILSYLYAYAKFKDYKLAVPLFNKKK